MQDLQHAYGGKRVLLTGHTGFKGGWLALWLSSLGAKVTGIALPPLPGHSLFDALRLDMLIDHRIGDIRLPEDYARAADRVEPDLVIHMAAQALVRPSYAEPVNTYLTNVVGTAVVLDHVTRQQGVRGVIVVSSDKCYENNEWPWPYREIDPMGGADPYSASKGCTELVASSFRRSFFADAQGCQLASARAGNVIGGGDWAVDRLVPDIIRATLAGAAVTIRNPASVRPWQHVLEPLSGYLMLGAKLLGDDASDFAEGWNFGPGADDVIDVEAIARGVTCAWGPGAADIAFGKRVTDPDEARILKLDSSKARTRLGWKPRLTSQQAVDLTAEWYRAYASESRNMRDLTLEQIARYAGPDSKNMSINEKVRQCA